MAVLTKLLLNIFIIFFRRKAFRSKRIQGRWITDDIHDIKYNEDKLQFQFRLGKLGTYALATPRYSNIPFQGWDIKPDLKK